MAEKISQKMYDAVCVPFEAVGSIAGKSDGLEKTSKLIVSVIDGLQSILAHYGKAGLMAGTVILKGNLKMVADVISGLNIVNRLYEWVCPEPGKKVPFWLAKPVDRTGKFVLRMKIVSRMFLTAAHAIDFAKLMDAFGLVSLGKIASETVGRVPVINLVKDTCVVISSVFAIMGNTATLSVETPKLTRATARAKQWKEVGDQMHKAGNATGRADRQLNEAARQNLEDRLAKKCVDKVKFYDAERQSAIDELVRLTGKKDLVDQLVANNFPDAAARAAAEKELLAAPVHYENRLQKMFGRFGRYNSRLQQQQTDKVKALLKKPRLMAEKKDKWESYIVAAPTPRNPNSVVLRGVPGDFGNGLEGYSTRKLDRAIDIAARDVAKKQATVDNIAAEYTSAAKQGAHASQQQALRKPMAELTVARAAHEALVQLRNNGDVTRYVEHRFEVCQANETNAFRKVTKSWLAIAYDVAKIAIIVLAVSSLMLGLVSFGWTMTIFAVALTVNSMGVAKFLYDELYAKKTVSAPRLTPIPV